MIYTYFLNLRERSSINTKHVAIKSSMDKTRFSFGLIIFGFLRLNINYKQNNMFFILNKLNEIKLNSYSLELGEVMLQNQKNINLFPGK